MPLSIKDPEADRLARALAQRTGETRFVNWQGAAQQRKRQVPGGIGLHAIITILPCTRANIAQRCLRCGLTLMTMKIGATGQCRRAAVVRVRAGVRKKILANWRATFMLCNRYTRTFIYSCLSTSRIYPALQTQGIFPEAHVK